MPSLSQREIERIVSKLDVAMVECTHHYRGWVIRDGQRVSLIHYSRGRKGLAGGAARSFARDLRLSVDEAVDFGRCRFDASAYFELVEGRPNR